MRSIFIIILTFLSISIIYSQNSEVDKRNGFKDIKLGSHYSNFEGIVEISNDNPNRLIGLWKTSDEYLGYFFEDRIDFLN